MNLKDLPLPALEQFASSLGEQKFRARQIFKWAYQKRLDSFDQMTNMPKDLRARLAENASLAKLPARAVLESAKGDAVKFGFETPDGYVIESVLLIDDDRRTACLSSQIGCALGCAFCETGKLGLIRNLSQAEILGQLIGINDYLYNKEDRLVTNVVFMGMGEALSNFDNFMGALSVIMHEDAFNIGARRITVSTAGVVPSVEKLMREDLSIGLAISLNAWNDELRAKMMPINKKYPIKTLTDIAKKYHNKTGRRVTFEYVLIAAVTDTPEAADALKRLLGGFPCKINLIPINPITPGGGPRGRPEERPSAATTPPPSEAPRQGGEFGYLGASQPCPPDNDAVDANSPPWRGGRAADGAVPGDADAFAAELHRRGLAATVRRSRGQDIMGACGQLTANTLK